MTACQLAKKSTVNWDVCPAIESAQDAISKSYWTESAKAVVTSARDGKHSKQTAHDNGNAIDLRISNLFPERRLNNRVWYTLVRDFAHTLASALQRLPSAGRFDVVLERDHIHLEHSVGRVPNITGWVPDQFVYCNPAVKAILDPVNPKAAA